MRNCIIFGCGFYGKSAFYKLSLNYNVIYYVDNNSDLWDNNINGVLVLSPNELYSIYDDRNTDIIICCRSYMEIYRQLACNGITVCYSMIEGFMYRIDSDETPYPVSLNSISSYKKQSDTEKNILYVQNTACIRTHKIAAVMKKLGYKVFLLCTIAPPEYNNKSFDNIYSDIFMCSSADEIVKFIDNSDFDIIHSSNEPDILTSIIVGTNKKIIFDTHDMMSMCEYNSIEHLTLEYIANTRSDGLIHVSDGCYDIAKKKYNIAYKPALILGNYPLEQALLTEIKPKLSATDGEIHCVYEGGMTFNDTCNARYFRDIWKSLLDVNVHIHFYTSADEISCRKYAEESPYLHYEGNLGSNELVNELTQYDFGLALFNINKSNRKIYEYSSQNKMYDYLNSRLPILASKLKSYADFIVQYSVGVIYDPKSSIKQQVNEILGITISEKFLSDNNLTMMANADKIEKFYLSLI